MNPEPAYNERFRRYSSSTISDALDRLQMRAQVAHGIRRLSGVQPIAGPVITACLRESSQLSPGRHILTSVIDAVRPESILVIANDNRTTVACWGELLTMGAQCRGLLGMITDGAVRDVEEIRARSFPVFARSATPVSARGRLADLSAGEPIVVSGVRVEPGDYAVADGSGVVFVPRTTAREVLELAERLTEREQRIVSAILAGARVSELMLDAPADAEPRNSQGVESVRP